MSTAEVGVSLHSINPKRKYLFALRDGGVCCPTCENNNPSCFSREGLKHHYRTIHKQVNFTDEIFVAGIAILRTRAAAETLSNLFALSEKRKETVS